MAFTNYPLRSPGYIGVPFLLNTQGHPILVAGGPCVFYGLCFPAALAMARGKEAFMIYMEIYLLCKRKIPYSRRPVLRATL